MSEMSESVVMPPTKPAPGVLVLHAWWGLTDFTRDFRKRLAREGFAVYAPDLFAGRTAQTPAEAERLLEQVRGETMPARLLAATDVLLSSPGVQAGRLGVVGFSYGAFWALWLAEQHPELVSAVSLFYGTNGGSGDFSASRSAFQGHFAENDPYEPPEGIQALEAVLHSAGRPVDFHTYSGAGHWFFEADRPEAYQPQAAQLAWDRTLAFLRRNLAGGAGSG